MKKSNLILYGILSIVLSACNNENNVPMLSTAITIASNDSQPLVATLPPNLAKKATYGESISTESTFKDPVQAEKLRRQIQDSIIDAELLNR